MTIPPPKEPHELTELDCGELGSVRADRIGDSREVSGELKEMLPSLRSRRAASKDTKWDAYIGAAVTIAGGVPPWSGLAIPIGGTFDIAATGGLLLSLYGIYKVIKTFRKARGINDEVSDIEFVINERIRYWGRLNQVLQHIADAMFNREPPCENYEPGPFSPVVAE